MVEAPDGLSTKRTVSTRDFACVPTCPASTCPALLLRFLAARLRERCRGIGTRCRRLSGGRQALLALAHLHNCHPYAQLASGFGIGIATV